jgi:DNA-binding NarL/FixJ family response regulator
MHPEGAHAARLIRSGAASYLNKSRPVSELLEAIRRVVVLGRYVVPELDERVRAKGSDPDDGPARLSEREHQIFLQLVDGLSPADVGNNLSLASSTVSTHIRRIKDKLEVETVAQMVHLAVKWGLR